jgi:hypothetical protein
MLPLYSIIKKTVFHFFLFVCSSLIAVQPMQGQATSKKGSKKPALQNIIKNAEKETELLEQSVNKSNEIQKDSILKEETYSPIKTDFEWISFHNSKSRNSQEEQIKQEITKLINQNRYLTDKADKNLRDSIWNDYKDTLNQNWYSTFFKDEKEFSKSYQDYLLAKQSVNLIKGQIAAKKQELDAKKVEYMSRQVRLEEYKEWIKKGEKDFKSRLANLSYSKLILANKVIKPTEGQSEIKEKVYSLINQAAISMVIGIELNNIVTIRGDSIIKSTIISSTEGSAETSDELPFQSNKEKQRIYNWVVRVDVFPFATNRLLDDKSPTARPVNRDSLIDESISLYDINSSGAKKLLVDNARGGYVPSDNIIPIKDLVFQHADVKTKIDYYASFNDRLNKMLEKKIKEYQDEYHEQLEVQEKLQKEQLRGKDSLYYEVIKTMEESISRLNNDLSQSENSSNGKYSEYLVIKNNYEKHYKNRKSFINKSEIDLDNNKSALECYQSIGVKTLKIVDVLKKRQMQSTVLFEQKNAKSSDKDFVLKSDKEVSYRPDATKFSIIYLYEEDGQQSLYNVNIGYEISWATFENDKYFGKDSLIDFKNKLLWFRTENNYFSADGVSDDPLKPEGFSLPSIDQLKTLYNEGKTFFEKNDGEKDMLRELNWSSDYPFISSEQLSDKDGAQLYPAFDMRKNMVINLKGGKSAYVLYVKPYVPY